MKGGKGREGEGREGKGSYEAKLIKTDRYLK